MRPRQHRFALVVVALAAVPPARAQAPGAPLLDAVRESPDVVLAWAPVANATSYRIERTADLATPFQLLGQGPLPGYRDVGAVPGPPANPSPYYYRVIAENAIGPGPPSNLAFKLNVPLVYDAAAPNRTPVSIPYRFFPLGLGGPPATSRDFCAYAPGVSQVARASPQGCRLMLQACPSSKTVFSLTPAEAYFFAPDAPGRTLDIVGAHDPDFDPGGTKSVALRACADCGQGFWHVAVPLHAAARTAAALCAELTASGTPVVAVRDVHQELRAEYLHYCGTPIGDFALVAGRAYEIRTTADSAWQPVVR